MEGDKNGIPRKGLWDLNLAKKAKCTKVKKERKKFTFQTTKSS